MAEFSTAPRSPKRLEARIASLSNPFHRAWLSTCRDHRPGEAVDDIHA